MYSKALSHTLLLAQTAAEEIKALPSAAGPFAPLRRCHVTPELSPSPQYRALISFALFIIRPPRPRLPCGRGNQTSPALIPLLGGGRGDGLPDGDASLRGRL